MKNLYSPFNRCRALRNGFLFLFFRVDHFNRAILLFTILMGSGFFVAPVYAQVTPAGFNESFWSGYADKLQLSGADREEFMSAHRKDYAASLTPTVQEQAAGKTMGLGNVIFAGPCINADFEQGNLTGWVRSCGFHPGYNALGCCPNPNGQQTIMTGAGTDPYGGFPLVFPGGNFSLRLGNNGTGGQADRIEQTFLVSPSNANFSYKYAVVFEDPNHPANQQPFFQVDMLDSTGAAVPCTFYYVAAGSGIPGFFNSSVSGVIYKPWSTVMVDLTPYIGQNITIRFSTYDCSLGGHFGYAYIDGVCESFSGGGTATVCAGASTVFCAPTGVESYTWNGPGVNNLVSQCATVTSAGIYTVSTTLLTGCLGPSFTYTLYNQLAPVVDAGPSVSVCANNSTVSITGSISAFPATPVWSSSGSGIFTSSTNIVTSYVPSPADITAGSVSITLSTANNGVCPVSTDVLLVTITPSPVLNAGTGGARCSINPFLLNGSVIGGASTGVWSTSGSGNFSPAPTALNASYTPSPADITAGTVTLTLTSTNYGNCLAVNDTVIINIRQPATVQAGSNQWICSTTPSIGLSGVVSGGGNTGIWSASGLGGFSPSATNLNSTYSITAADISSGQVIFTLTSTNNGPCPAVSDTVKMAIQRPSTVTAGANQFVCSTAGTINLTGSVSGYSNTGTWSHNGFGIFSPGAGSLSTGYIISPQDFITGLVDFTLSSTNNGPCAAVSDTVRMRIRIPAIVNAGINQAVCSNLSAIALSGSVTGGSSTGTWISSGGGAFSPNAATLSPSYAITPADIALGNVIFTLSSTNNGPCAVVQDSVKIRIVNLATVTAGPNQLICSSNGVINLAGSVNSPSNTLQWSSGGAGAFNPSNSVIAPVYSLTAADITAGLVTFTATSTNNGPCPAVSDSVMIAIRRLAQVNAGPNQNICSSTPTLNLNGTLGGGATSAQWTTSGAGGFTPSSTSLSSSYAVNAADIANGTVVFTLSSTNNGPCPVVADTVMMRVTRIATLSAGPNLYVCSNAGTLALAGSITSPSNTALWSGNGSGQFLPLASAVAASYSMSAADINAGQLTFTLSSTNNGPCPVVRDTVKMRIMRLPAVNAGPNKAVCSAQGNFVLNGTVTGGGNAGSWISSGSGTFSQNTAASASYSMSAQDISNGSVVFTLTSQNSTPCPEITDTVNVVINTQAQVQAGASQTVCSSVGSVQLGGLISGGTGAVQWSATGSGTYSPTNTDLSPVYIFTPVDILIGSLTFSLSSTNNGACSKAVSTVLVRIDKLANVNAGPDRAVCSGQSLVPLQGTITGVTNQGNWSGTGSGSFSPNATAGGYSLSAADISAGNLTMVLTSQNNGVCPSVSDTMRITIETKPSIAVAPDTTVCDNLNLIPLSYTATSGSPMQWATTGTGIFLPNNAPSATHYSLSINDKTGGSVSLMLGTSSTGPCGYTGAAMKVDILKGPRADFAASTYVLQNPGDQVQFTNTSSSAASYTWNFGDGSTTTISDPQHIYPEVGYYTVSLQVKSLNGCTDVSDKVLTVISDVQFATAFTPNPNGANGGHYDPNDYSNDVFFPFARGVVEFDMMIFNRWGELIFKSNDVNIGWDGYFNGKLCQQDTYVWKVNMGFFDGRKYNGTGSITLLR